MANNAKGLELAAILAEQLKYLAKILRRDLEGESDMEQQVLAGTIEEKAEEVEAVIDAEWAKADKRRK
jgi:hypothetical protein